MSAPYTIARLPIDAAKGALELAYWPVHFVKTIGTNVVDTGFKVIGTSTEDKPLESVSGESIYELSNFNLNVASMIYYYTELRSEIKKAAKELAKNTRVFTGNVLENQDIHGLSRVNTRVSSPACGHVPIG